MEMDNLEENLIKELDLGLGDGPLTLEMVCCDCNTHFELSKESVAIAFMMRATFADYVRYIQSSKCRVCEEKREGC
jgi:hypothetical protein